MVKDSAPWRLMRLSGSAVFVMAGARQCPADCAVAFSEGSSGPLVFRPLMKRPVDAVTEGIGGLVCEGFFQIAEDDAHEEVLLPRLRPEAADSRSAPMPDGAATMNIPAPG